MRNQENDILKRKYANTLVVCGQAGLILTIWSLLKAVLYFTTVHKFGELLGEEYEGKPVLIGIVVFILLVLVLIDSLLRIYVYKCAVSEGKGIRDRGYLYIVITALMIMGCIGSIIAEVFRNQSLQVNEFEKFASILVELTSLVCSIDLVYSAIRLKKLNRLTASSSEEVNC